MTFAYKTPSRDEINGSMDVAMQFVKDRTRAEADIDAILADMLNTPERDRLPHWRYRELIMAVMKREGPVEMMKPGDLDPLRETKE